MPLVPSRRMPSRLSGSIVGEAREGVARPFAHALVRLDPVGALERFPAFAFGQRDHAPRRAPPGADPRPGVGLLDQHQLGRSAADVEDQRRAVAGLEQLVAAEDGEARFFLRLDDVERDPGLVRTRSANSAPLVARRHASVATERDSETLRRRNLSAQTDSAPTARSIASCAARR